MNYLYLHGFRSSPQSKKGVAFDAYFAPRGIAWQRLDLREPLRLSAMIAKAAGQLGDGAVIAGSSLGGLTAAWTAARDPRVQKLILMAPAFQLVSRWKDAVPDADPDFIADVARIDVGFPRIEVPTLIFHGIHDASVPVQFSRDFAAQHPGARLIELDDDHELVASLPVILPEVERFLA